MVLWINVTMVLQFDVVWMLAMLSLRYTPNSTIIWQRSSLIFDGCFAQ